MTYRDNAIKLLKAALSIGLNGFDRKAAEKKAEKIEIHVYRKIYLQESREKYCGKMRSLVWNLRHNPVLRKKVISGEISEESFSIMPKEAMQTNEQRCENQRIKLENLFTSIKKPEPIAVRYDNGDLYKPSGIIGGNGVDADSNWYGVANVIINRH
ncbi:6547_t:CDS:2 [Ambispora leptoticha]|uniref:6547_t:CDS:1 n=1 Tax=Ambispora leptoticha TaxID=144679 RepID=A0A9N8ZDF1_9GLOM|nr:6547_t:CDS:2 [Ambispora leptoticha]